MSKPARAPASRRAGAPLWKPAVPTYPTLGLPRKHWRVLGAGLNCTESSLPGGQAFHGTAPLMSLLTTVACVAYRTRRAREVRDASAFRLIAATHVAHQPEKDAAVDGRAPGSRRMLKPSPGSLSVHFLPR